MDWTTPKNLADQLLRLWSRGRILAAPLTDEILFPRPLPLRRPDSSAMSDRFEAVRAWIRALEAGSRAQRGFGYEIEWAEINHRQLGRNRIPAGITVPTEGDALRLIGKEREADRFRRLAAATAAACPVLTPWLARFPLVALQHAADWDRILRVLGWFRDRPRSGLYLRQIDIPGVDTKFIETRKTLLSELLDRVLADAVAEPDLIGSRFFERRYGLRTEPPLIRFRILDDRLALHGLTDIGVPVAAFARLAPPARRVFITENKVNGLAFPETADSLVIFGLGYGVDALAGADWLKDRDVHYWGDIDTHGFGMLDRLRAHIPGAQSLLMDRQTLMAHRPLWGREEKPNSGPLPRLTAAERSVFDDLRQDRLGTRLRLEQEHVAFGWLERALQRIEASGRG